MTLFVVSQVINYNLFSRSKKFTVYSDNTNFHDDMRPSTYFNDDGSFNYSKFGSDQYHWSGIVASNCSLLHRVPYFLKRLCDGNYSRTEVHRRINELYKDSLKNDGSEFVTAVAEALSDSYDFQRLSKRVGTGKL